MYTPKASYYTHVPRKRHIQHPLDNAIHRAFHVRRSANTRGRIVLSPSTRFEPLLLPTLPKTEFTLPIYIDSSMLSLWRACRRKHYWSTLRGLYPTGKSVHLVAGAALAAGLEAARRFVFASPDPASIHHDDILMAAYPAFHHEWGDYDPPENNPRNAKTFVHTFAALANYLYEYHPGRDAIQPVIRTDGTPAVEYRFAIPLPILHPSGDPFLFVGRFDLLGFYSFANSVTPVVCDEKTASSFTFDWAEKWDLRGQFIGYLWALRQQGIAISHAVARGIAIQKTQYDVRTAFIQYPDFIFSRWETQMLRDVQAMKDSFLNSSKELYPIDRKSHYSMDFADACDSYGGCAFRTLCSQYDPEPFVSNYILHRWNPLARQPVEETSIQSPLPHEGIVLA
jgi:hypothetical protein